MLKQIKPLHCQEHNNPIERICLQPTCKLKSLCLLCESHLHGKQFYSIMDKRTQNYRRFCRNVNDAIDQFFLEANMSEDEEIKRKQKELLKQYHKNLKKRIQVFLQERFKHFELLLQSDQDKYKTLLKDARIKVDYVNVSPEIFQICSRAYEGQGINQVLQHSQQSRSEQLYEQISIFHQQITQQMQNNDFAIQLKPPEIRIKKLIEDKIQHQVDFFTQNDYETQHKEETALFQSTLIYETQPFDSIISSAYKTDNGSILTVGYDKMLRIVKKNNRVKSQLQVLQEFQFSNILTKIHSIGQDLYAIGQSKQLLVQKIQQQQSGKWSRSSILKLLGHQQRINEIHSYNTRILGSSSPEGVKIWDLYKEKCQFTLKEKNNPSTFVFLPKINTLAVGYNNHICKLYSVQKLKTLRHYDLPGLPLLFSQEKLNQNTFYTGGFSSHLGVIDSRLKKLVFNFNFEEDAIESLSQMVFQENKILIGFRNGKVKIFDLKTRKVVNSFIAQNQFSQLSKPNGIIGIFEEDQKRIITVGCNEKKLKLWEIKQPQI